MKIKTKKLRLMCEKILISKIIWGQSIKVKIKTALRGERF
jgi:hypothetical protein